MHSKKQNKNIYVISNMYPSTDTLRYGVFVKSFIETINPFFQVKKIVITKKKFFLTKITAYFFLYLKILRLVFTSKKEDLIYIHYPLHVSIALFPLLLLKRKIILNFHGSDLEYDSFFKKILGFFQDYLIQKSNIVVPSLYYKKRVLEKYKVNSKNVFIYPSGGIDTAIFYESSTQKSVFTIGYVSSFIKSKGWEAFLEALVILKKNIIFEVIMVGDGPDKNLIKKFIKQENLPIIIKSNLNRKQLAKEYNKINLFVFPTTRTSESLGLVGLEAMACGVPVVGSKIAGLLGYLKNDYNGLFFQPGNVDELASRINSFYNFTPEKHKLMKDNAIKTALSFDKNKVNKKLIKHLINLVND